MGSGKTLYGWTKEGELILIPERIEIRKHKPVVAACVVLSSGASLVIVLIALAVKLAH